MEVRVGAGTRGGSREGRRSPLLQWPTTATPWGGKGDRQGGGGAGRPKKPLRPPQHDLNESPENWGGRAPAAGGMWRGGLGCRERPSGSRATRPPGAHAEYEH